MDWRSAANSIGLLILRLGFGGYMLSHGWGKFQMLLAGDFDKFADPVGMGKELSLVLAVLAEFVCSILVIVGLLTRLAAVPLVVTMAVAAFVVHANDPWSSETAAKAFFAMQSETWASKEPALLFLTAFLAMVFTGPGRISVDGLFWRRRVPATTTTAP
jgi:putative oxidoreductase